MNCCINKNLENFPFLEENLEAIEMYELLCELNKKIEDVIKDVEKLKYLEEYIEQLEQMKSDINSLKLSIRQHDNRINDNALRIEVVNDNLTQLINNNYDILKSYVDTQDANLEQEIRNIQIGDIKVYDPSTGLFSPLQTVINNLYGIGNEEGLTASEFEALNLTVTSFQNYNISAYDFDSKGKIILV